MEYNNTERKKVAVLIDAENISLRYLEKIFTRARSEGNVCFKRIYGNVTLRKNAVNPLLEYGITHIQCYSYVPDKNTADMVLTVDAMEQLYKNGIDVFCIVSSDSDFAPLVNKMIEEGKTVIGMGERKAVKSFRNSCNEFILLDEDEPEEEAPPPPAFEQVKADIEELLSASTDADGWVRFKLISDTLNKKYTFSPTNYDFETMVELIDSMGFEITNKTTFGRKTYYARIPRATVDTVPEPVSFAETEATDTEEINVAEETLPEASEVSPEEIETAPTSPNLDDGVTAEKPAAEEVAAKETPAEPTPMDILGTHLIAVMKAGANKKGYMRLTTAVTELQKRLPDFSARNYGFSSATKLFEALGCDFKDKGTSSAYVKLGKTLADRADTAAPEKTVELSPELLTLQHRIAIIAKELADKDGWCMLSKVIMELKSQDPNFSTKIYGAKNSVALVELLPAVELEKRYASHSNKGAYDAYIRVRDFEYPDQTPIADPEPTVAEEPKNEPAENILDNTAPTETEIEIAPVITVETETAETETEPQAEEEQEAAITDGTDENTDTEEEESANAFPLYVDLPDTIDTKEQLRNAIIFILSTESVTSPTRLSAPLKRYFPDFKIKNYGHTKMKQLLEDLGLFVF